MASKQPILFTTSQTVQAVVFSESAHVTRRAATQLEAGLARVVLEGLPPGLDPGKLRVNTSLGTVRSIETDEIIVDPEPVPTAIESALSIDDLQKAVHRLTGELEALRSELAMIDRVSPSTTDQEGGMLRPDVFLAGLDVVIKRRREALYALRSAAYELDRADDRLQIAMQHQRAVGDKPGTENREAKLVISLDVGETGDCALDVTYESVWATWRPFYNIRLDEPNQAIEVVQFADIWQDTGEDWEDVQLRFSTSEPEPGLRLPRILPWLLESRKSYEDQASALYARKPKKRKAVPKPARPPPPPPMSRPAAPGFGRAGGGDTQPYAAAGASPQDFLVASEFDMNEYETTGDFQVDAGLGGDTLSGPPDEFDSYAQQFEEEGIYSEVTSAGIAASHAQLSSLTKMGAAHEPHPREPSYPTPIPDSPPPSDIMAPSRRLPSPDHPDWERLASEQLPRDSSGGINWELEAPGESTCRSGSQRRRLRLGSFTCPSRVEYLLRPAARDHAFGRVTVTNNQSSPLLAGPTAIFVDDAFFGQTKIETTPAGGKLILDLGAETSIKCKRRSTTTIRTEGIITKEDIHVVDVTIEIESFLDRVAELEVQDQVPVSDDARVKVRLMKTSPQDANLDELSGILTFRTKVPPGGRTEVNVVYEIEAPKDYRLVQQLKEK